MSEISRQFEGMKTLGPKLLGIDTCGPAGSVTLGQVLDGTVEILGQRELEGRKYSATLVSAVGDMLASACIELADLAAVVVVNGPGSFTGVRVGLSAAKGLVEPACLPIVAVSRLEVLAAKAGTISAALDAHRHEVFLRIGDGGAMRELLAGTNEFSEIGRAGGRIAVCDDAAAALLAANWPDAELVRVEAPTAADALSVAAPRVSVGQFDDAALLDGHYLRRSDAEIFGESATVAAKAK